MMGVRANFRDLTVLRVYGLNRPVGSWYES